MSRESSTDQGHRSLRGAPGTRDGAVLATDEGARSDGPIHDRDTSWTDLTGFQRDLLKSIQRLDGRDAVPKGKAIKAQMEWMYGEEINHSRLYQNLNSLTERGCIEKVVVDGRTNAYFTTPKAEELLREAMVYFTGSGDHGE